MQLKIDLETEICTQKRSKLTRKRIHAIKIRRKLKTLFKIQSIKYLAPYITKQTTLEQEMCDDTCVLTSTFSLSVLTEHGTGSRHILPVGVADCHAVRDFKVVYILMLRKHVTHEYKRSPSGLRMNVRKTTTAYCASALPPWYNPRNKWHTLFLLKHLYKYNYRNSNSDSTKFPIQYIVLQIHDHNVTKLPQKQHYSSSELILLNLQKNIGK